MKKTIFLLIALCALIPVVAFCLGEGGIQGGGTSGTVTEVTGDSMIGVATGTSTPALSLTDNSVTNAKLLDNTIATGKIADGTIVNADISASAAIDATKVDLSAYATLVSPSFTTPTLGVATATTLSTGQGQYELYAMDQDVKTTDNVVFNTVTAEIISPCTATDNDCFLEAVNAGALDDAYLKAGRLWFDNTLQAMKVRNNDNTATLEVFTSGAAHTLNFATTGTITGGIMILDNVVSPTVSQVYGSWNTITTAGTVTLPAAATGMSTCIATEGALEITLELDGSDTFVLAGVTMDAGEAIINTTAEAAGDYICVIATSAVKWRVAGKQGTWTQATP